jgi:GNAT superfamily N-acetyltransferase
MAQLILHKKIEEYLKYNEEYLFGNYFSHYVFIKLLENRHTTNTKINNAFNIIDDDGSFVVGLVANRTDVYFYASNWNESVILETTKFAHLDSLPPQVYITGSKPFILELIKHNNIQYDIFKDRTIYSRDSEIENYKFQEGHFGLATKDDIEEISKMSYLWHLEEYKEDAFRTPEFMGEIVEKGILGKTFYKWAVGNEVVSIAQIMYSDNGYPVIGHFYTSENFRKKGYGSSLLVSLTNLILGYGHEKCGLISDNSSIASNAVFIKIGYEKIYETIAITSK